MDRQIIVTIATQRSGTKFLCGCLNAGTLVRSVAECFQPGEPRRLFPTFLAGWFARHPEFDFRSAHMHALLGAFLDEMLARSDRPILHFDVMYNNLGGFSGAWAWPPPGGGSLIAAVLRARNLPIIHLVRDSPAECHASTLIAEHRGWHRRTALAEPDAALRLVAEPRRAAREIRAILDARDFVRRTFRRHPRLLELRYPDFIDGQRLAPAAQAGIAALLGLPADTPVAGAADLRPTAPDKAQVIENWDELVAIEATIRAERAARRG
ncbi:hypothetical protein [Roseomonas fluvialis]|uniref:Sulfotransferase family protein n=1 Tax=Roseomonas fluvialis TaxID=1750527 RepID=A0ABN6NXE6_9PROT|nr:hypothetical protein [Roseomonas fluvialis]BDG70671.1 hypothetical protein Rmf_06000 [Roseomonas fluvialis]